MPWLFLAFICVAALMRLNWRPGEILTEARIQPRTSSWAGGWGGAPRPLGKQKLSAKSVYPDLALRGDVGDPGAGDRHQRVFVRHLKISAQRGQRRGGVTEHRFCSLVRRENTERDLYNIVRFSLTDLNRSVKVQRRALEIPSGLSSYAAFVPKLRCRFLVPRAPFFPGVLAFIR